MSHHVAWDKGGTAIVIAISNDAATLRSTVPSPPGSRIGGTLLSDASVTVKFKVHSSRIQEDGMFLIVGRPIDLSTPTREKLLLEIAG